MLPIPDQSTDRNPSYLWIKRWIAVLAVVNLALVFFDLTYLQARSLYLQVIPHLVQIYDPVKGIHPHPETQRYLASVAALEATIAKTEIGSAEVEAALAELRFYSQRLVQDHPFVPANSAILATIQQNLQTRTGAESTFVAFERFWNQGYLIQAGWQAELEFWSRQIQPLMQANYYRQVNRFGQTVDYFWLIDLPFMLIFAIDLMIRNRAIRLRNPSLSRLEAILRRWYDFFLLLPIWQWLRIIPTTIRLHQVGLLNLAPLQAEAQRDFAIGFAKELTELAGIQAIDQVQAAIRRGDVMQWLLYPESRREYVQVNERDEFKEIIFHITEIIIDKVLPAIQSDAEQLIYLNLRYLVDQFPGYRQLKHIPGISHLPKQTTERWTRQLSQQVYQSLVQLWEDPKVAEVAFLLSQRFRDALAAELKQKHNTQAIEELLIDMLEEIKINYVKGITEVRIKQIIEEAEQLHRIQA